MSDASYVNADHLPGRTLLLENEEYLFFSGTSYLGVSSSPAFQKGLIESMQRYGTNYSSSRHSNLQLQVYEEAEAFLANYTGAEAALTMSSGYLAGQALVQVLQGSGYFMYAPGTHPAVWRSMADAPKPNQEYEEWVSQVLTEIAGLAEDEIVLVCNSLDPLKARNYTFDWVASLPEHKRYTLIIDDSHGFGITGKEGIGVFDQLRTIPQRVRVVVVSSMGKAFGIPAGVILGYQQLISQIKASPYFGGASPAVPAYLYAFLHCQPVFAEARQKLWLNISNFLDRLKRPDQFSYFKDYPVFSTSNQDLCNYLLKHKVLISSFRYPSPADEPVTRIILNSLHTAEDIAYLAECINHFNA